MKKIAVIGWEEGLSGQISQWLPFKIEYYIHPDNEFPKIDLKKLVSEMIKKDKAIAEKESFLIQKGYKFAIPKE